MWSFFLRCCAAVGMYQFPHSPPTMAHYYIQQPPVFMPPYAAYPPFHHQPSSPASYPPAPPTPPAPPHPIRKDFMQYKFLFQILMMEGLLNPSIVSLIFISRPKVEIGGALIHKFLTCYASRKRARQSCFETLAVILIKIKKVKWICKIAVHI